MLACRSRVGVKVEVSLGLSIQEYLEEPDVLMPYGSLPVSWLYGHVEELSSQLQAPISIYVAA